MTPLRLEMISALERRNYARETIKTYVSHIEKFAKRYGKCPSKLGRAEIDEYFNEFIEKKYSSSHYRQVLSAFRFLYLEVLERDMLIKSLRYPRKSTRKIPEIPSPDEIGRVIRAPKSLRDQALIETLYGTGVRPRELVSLKISDIDSERMVIRIENSKWDKSRLTLLPASLLKLLRAYYREYRPTYYLFEGKKGAMSISVPLRVCVKAGEAAGLRMRLTLRLLRHCFATHMHESGESLLTIQALLGHSTLKTTEYYTHVSTEKISRTRSPLDLTKR